MDALLIRLDAPLLSFGGVLVDQINPTDRFPGRSLLTGLLANALGWDHRDQVGLQALQDRLHHAARWDLEPVPLVDYQTVDLGHPTLQGTGWTTRGSREDRGKGEATHLTHQRWRHYWANGCATVALTLTGGGEPTLEALEGALRCPARPLFIGRKTCLPAMPLSLGMRQGLDLRSILANEPLAEPGHSRTRPTRIPACWPAEEGPGAREDEVCDLRNWQNNMHQGSARYAFGFLEVAP